MENKKVIKLETFSKSIVVTRYIEQKNKKRGIWNVSTKKEIST